MTASQDAIQALAAKSQAAAAPAQQQPQQAAPQSAAPSDAQDDSTVSDNAADEAAAGKTNLLKQYSKLNSAIAEMFDSLGVKRSLSMPHQKGQGMAEHIQDVGTAIASVGGITANFLSATHSQHDSKGGATVAHPSEQLRQTIIPKNFEPARAVVFAVRTLVNKIEGLVGETPEVQKAKSVIALLGKSDMAGMNAFDAGAAPIALVHPLFQLLARRHSVYKHGGKGHAMLTPPKVQQ
jgi:hypothetical protein